MSGVSLTIQNGKFASASLTPVLCSKNKSKCSAPKDFWCGAGDYAIRVLRTSATQRIYLWQAVGPAVTVKGHNGVQFSLQSPQGADTNPGYSISVKKVGDNMTASMAQNYCYDRLTDDFWLRP